MSDISKCVNGCSKRLYCERWTSPPHAFRQFYSEFAPDPKTGICRGFYPNHLGAEHQVKVDDHLINHNED